ncbi:MAG: orotate phosphoribosyltransferase [Pseudomonadota bacterium]|nr:orotate phosphoribosyltransferase [Pseudomonadota bacterium]
MEEYKRNFLELAIKQGVLTFGEFTLKSGRKSPYFFNAGLFNTGQAVAALGQYYANAIIESGIEFDMIFGPAYKGIPLAALSTAALAEHHEINKPFSYNRKEKKNHGEGGVIVGAPLNGHVLIIDDVITAGTAVKEAFNLIENSNAKVAGLIVSIDRQEIGANGKSTIQELQDNFNIPVVSIAKLDDLIELIKISDDLKVHLTSIIKYRQQFGITT